MPVPPPSEPDRRVSRLRLSSQWVRSLTIVRVHSCAAAQDSRPRRASHSFGQRWCDPPRPCRVGPRRFSSRLLSRRLTSPSTVANPLAWRCWKHPYQLRPSFRAVCARTRSFRFFRRFSRGHFRPRPKCSPPPPCGDAVTVRYRTILHRTEADCHRPIPPPSQAHWRRRDACATQTTASRAVPWTMPEPPRRLRTSG